MAYVKQAKTEEEIRHLTVGNVRKAYNDLASNYNKILDGDLIRCDCCGEWISRSNFYTSNDNVIGVFPTCKKCVLMKVENKTNKRENPNETKESVQVMLQKMNLPYIDSLYESCKKTVEDEVNEKNKKSPFLQMVTILKSLPQYNSKTWKDSEFGLDDNTNPDYEIKENKKTLKNARKRFGNYSNEDLMMLENEYQDWITRYECNTKAQEAIFERLSFKKWEINKATREGKPTKDLDKTYTELLTTANVTPKQNVGNSFTESLTFGQLIEKWEEELPISVPEPEFRDVNKIGRLITVFKGALLRALNLDNGYNKEYDDYLAEYTVHKPEDISGENEVSSNDIYSKLFGSDGD